MSLEAILKYPTVFLVGLLGIGLHMTRGLL